MTHKILFPCGKWRLLQLSEHNIKLGLIREAEHVYVFAVKDYFLSKYTQRQVFRRKLSLFVVVDRDVLATDEGFNFVQKDNEKLVKMGLSWNLVENHFESINSV